MKQFATTEEWVAQVNRLARELDLCRDTDNYVRLYNAYLETARAEVDDQTMQANTPAAAVHLVAALEQSAVGQPLVAPAR